MLRNDHNNTFSCTEIAPLSLKPLYNASMCLVNDKFIYVTGGVNLISESVAKCHRYDIDGNRWEEMQEINQERSYHSSCQLAGHIYVICG